MINPSVIIRRKAECVRNSVNVLGKQAGITIEDELNISSINRMLAQIDERHRDLLKLSGKAVLPARRRALAADCLTSAERSALKERLSGGGDHDPAA